MLAETPGAEMSRPKGPDRNDCATKGLTSKGLCDIRPHVKGPHAKRPQWVRQNPPDLASATGKRPPRQKAAIM